MTGISRPFDLTAIAVHGSRGRIFNTVLTSSCSVLGFSVTGFYRYPSVNYRSEERTALEQTSRITVFIELYKCSCSNLFVRLAGFFFERFFVSPHLTSETET